MKLVTIKLRKLKELEDAEVPNNIPVEYETERVMTPESFNPPKIGECFWAGGFRTSMVQELLTEDTFKTVNSVYQWDVSDPYESIPDIAIELYDDKIEGLRIKAENKKSKKKKG